MANRSSSTLLRHIRTLASKADVERLSDRELLKRFTAKRDEAAFANLVHRHGPMVQAVCHRVLRHAQDAEDVFQATFLVLAQKSCALRWQESVGNWLYGVAYRLALKAKVQAARRNGRQGRALRRSPPDPLADVSVREAQAILDAELARLPEKYRSPLVICCLEGATRDEAARQLGWSASLVKSRLQDGRQRLRRRLVRRGLTLPAALAAALLAEGVAAAAVPAALACTTVAAALRIAAGQAVAGTVSAQVATLLDTASKSLSVMKLKTATILLLGLCVLGAGAGVVAERASTTNQPQAQRADQSNAAEKETPKPVYPNQPRTDRYGDPLPKDAIARLGTKRFRHGARVDSAEFSPDGKTIASAGSESVKLWDAATGKELRRLGKAYRFFGVVFSPDGKLLASVEHLSPTNRIHVWEVATGKEVWQVTVKRWSVSVAFSPDSKTLTAATEAPGDDPPIIVWGAATGRQLRRSEGPPGGVFSPDGKLLASPGEKTDHTIRLWDPATGKLLATLRGHAEHVFSLAFSRDGKLLASCAGDYHKPEWTGEIRLWDVAARKERAMFKAPAVSIHWMGLSPSGKILASGHMGGLIVLSDAASGKEIRRWQAGGINSYVVPHFSPDGKTLVSTAGLESGLRLWEVATGKEVRPFAGHHTPVDLLAFSRDGKALFSGGRYQGILRWDLATGRERHWFYLNNFSVGPCEPSPDGKIVATWERLDRTVRLWDAPTGKQLRLLGKHQWDSDRAEAPWRAVAFSPDGKLLASADNNPSVRLWDVASGKELREFRGLQGETYFVLFSPDGKTFAAATYGRGNEIRLWDVATGRELRVLRHDGAYSIAFSPDGKWLASAGYGTPVKVWDVATGKEAGPPIGPSGRGVFAITFSPDGRFLAGTGQDDDKSVYIWEVVSRREARRFRGHDSGAGSVAFSPGGRSLASGGWDSSILLWDMTGRTKDGQLQPAQLTPRELQARWKDLAGDDAPRALQSMWDLVASPREAVPFLNTMLRPAEAVEGQRLDRLIADLDSHEFRAREKATEGLEKLGDLAEPALRKALTKPPSLEVRRRLQRLVEKIERDIPAGDRLRALRSVAVLEYAGTPEAQDVLKTLAQGAPAARLTQEAKASLDRLAKRTTTAP